MEIQKKRQNCVWALDMPSEELTNVSFSFFFMCVWKIIMQNIFFWYLYVGHINYWLGANTITTKCLFPACICSTWLVGTNQMKWKFNNLFLASFFSALTTQFFRTTQQSWLAFLSSAAGVPANSAGNATKKPEIPPPDCQSCSLITGYGIQHKWLLSSHGAATASAELREPVPRRAAQPQTQLESALPSGYLRFTLNKSTQVSVLLFTHAGSSVDMFDSVCIFSLGRLSHQTITLR